MEIDLLRNYPKSKRDTKGRSEIMSEDVRDIARQYGKDFFDGDRLYGYGGFHYHPRFWQPVMPDFIAHFELNAHSHFLDVGCAKGFTLYDLTLAVPGITIRGLDISEYAIENAKDEVKPFLDIGCASNLPYDDNSFDTAISVNTVHNLDEKGCAKALLEIMRVSKGKSFVTVDAWRNDEEKERMMQWALTAKTMLHVDDWKTFFKDVGYNGDFYWFFP